MTSLVGFRLYGAVRGRVKGIKLSRTGLGLAADRAGNMLQQTDLLLVGTLRPRDVSDPQKRKDPLARSVLRLA